MLQPTASLFLVTCPCRASGTSSARPRLACALDPSAHVQLAPAKVHRCVSVYLISQAPSRLTVIGCKFRRRFSHPVCAAPSRLERAPRLVPSPPRLLSIQGHRTAVPWGPSYCARSKPRKNPGKRTHPLLCHLARVAPCGPSAASLWLGNLCGSPLENPSHLIVQGKPCLGASLAASVLSGKEY